MAGGGFQSSGNTFFKQPGPPFAPTSADNGLSVDPVTGRMVLGNDQFDPAQPARLLGNREISAIAGRLLFTGITQHGEIGESVIGIFSDIDVSEAAFQLGAVSLANVPGNIAAVFFGVHDVVNEVEMLWDGAVPRISLRSRPVPQNGWQLFMATGNFRVGDDQPDNAVKLQVVGHISMLSATANLDFPNTAAQTSSDLTIALADAVVDDMVVLGTPAASANADSCYTAFVDSAGSVTVRFNNYSAGAIDPNPGDFTVSIFKRL